MREMTALYAAAESMMTHATALNTVADNLANVNTSGFKAERVEFADIIAASMGCMMGEPLDTGNGSMAADISAGHDIQGSLEFTQRELDTAIEGRGYFVLSNGIDRHYSRAGNFITDTEGNLLSLSGESVLGYANATTTELTPLNVTTAAGTATATTTVSLAGNLDSSALPSTSAARATWADINSAASFRTPVTVIDSLGQEHDIALYFFKGEQALTWTVEAYVDGAETGGTPGTPVPVGGGGATVTFGPDGRQAEGSATALTVNATWGNGASASAVSVDLSTLSGYAGSSALTGVSADGNKSGTLTGVEIEQNGDVVAVLDSGARTVIGTLALATFRAPVELNRVGDTNYIETEASGPAEYGRPGAGGRGSTRGKALESSTVDPAREFVSMVRYQRGYQASSKVITTTSEILNTAIQMA